MEKKPLHIAIVDDEEAVLSIYKMRMRREIQKNNIVLYTFLSGEKFLSFLQENFSKINIILLLSDINMPQMDGLQLLKIIKEKYPTIKVFVVSAYNSDEKMEQAQKLGADEYFTKPLSFKKLFKIIDHFGEQK